MGSSELRAAGAAALATRLPALGALTSLELESCDLEGGGEGTRALLRSLPAGLNSLHLHGNPLGDVGAAALAERAPALTALWHLQLADGWDVRIVSAGAGLRKLLRALPAHVHVKEW